jgi:hypothetical protein
LWNSYSKYGYLGSYKIIKKGCALQGMTFFMNYQICKKEMLLAFEQYLIVFKSYV